VAVTITVQAVPPPPFSSKVQVKAITDTASYGRELASGGLLTIFGEELSDKTYVASRSPWPTSLGPTTVAVCDPQNDPGYFNCVATPIIFASPTQINFVAPAGPLNRDLSVVVSRQGEFFSRPHSVRLSQYAPSVFMMGYDCSFNPLWQDPSPCGLSSARYSTKQPQRGAVTDQQGSLLLSSNPAKTGQYYTLWLTGLGAFTAGKPPATFLLRLGGTPTDAFYDVPVSFVGPSPQFQGLYQANFTLPAEMMGSVRTLDIQTCADYQMELSINVYEGSTRFPLAFQIPALVKSGEVACLPPRP
jgi:uncharacterized protein (TIGR03437 family)